MQTTQTPATRCLSCQYAEQDEMTDQQRNHRSLWGCTCEPENAAEALDFMDRVTR